MKTDPLFPLKIDQPPKMYYPLRNHLRGGKRRMITMADWVTIKNLKSKNPGMESRSIAKLLGLSRNTVKRALKSENGPIYI
jgi:DNA-binding MarR family transcriptional regulator